MASFHYFSGRLGLYYIRGAVYYIRMVQPTTPPLSIRVPPALLFQVDAWAKGKGCARHAAILLLIERGLGGGAVNVAGGAPKPSFSHGRSKTVVVAPKRRRADALGVQVGPVEVRPGALLKKR